MELEGGLYAGGGGLIIGIIFFFTGRWACTFGDYKGRGGGVGGSIRDNLRYLYTFGRLMRTLIPHLIGSIVFFLHDFSEVSPKGVYLCVEPFNLQ